MYSNRRSTHTPLKHNSGHNCVWSRSMHVDPRALKVLSHDCIWSCIFKLCVALLLLLFTYSTLRNAYPDRIQNGERKNTALWKVSCFDNVDYSAKKNSRVSYIYLKLSFLLILYIFRIRAPQ